MARVTPVPVWHGKGDCMFMLMVEVAVVTVAGVAAVRLVRRRRR